MCRNLHGFSVRYVAVVALVVASVACGSSGSSDDPQGSLLGPMIETDNGVIQGAHGGGDDGVTGTGDIEDLVGKGRDV